MDTGVPTRILYMEDDPGLGRLLQKRLRRMGYDVAVVEDGKEGLVLCTRKSFDLALVDHNMPGMTGIEVIRKLAENPEAPPIIMLTGQGDEDLAVRALKSGAADYLTKDVDGSYLDMLPSAINTTLINDRLSREKQRIEKELLESERFNRAILNSLAAHMAILDEKGRILSLNSAWTRFIKDHCNGHSGLNEGDNFLESCESGLAPYSGNSHKVVAGIRQLLSGERSDLQLTYECTLSSTQNWFTLRATRIEGIEPPRIVVAHEDVTELKRTEAALRLLSQKDGLTGLANRRHFDTILEQEWGRAMRNQSPLSLLMLDIDFFKPYNDSYGHLMGDECIKRVTSVIRQGAKRPGDLAARYGGEEFVVLLPDTDIRGAMRIAQSIQEKVADMAIPHESSDAAPHVTISIGVASVMPNASADPTHLVHQADTALYAAKQRGRNSIVRI